MASGVKKGKVSGVVYRVQGCLGHLVYKVNLRSCRVNFRTHARSNASESVSISISYFSIYLSNSSVPSTLRIFNSWSTLSDPLKKCSLRNICGFLSSQRGIRDRGRTNQGSKHTTNAPHVQAVVVALVTDQEFWAFVVTTTDPDVVFGTRVVEFCQAPVDKPQLQQNR